MAAISASQVKDLRERTGLGMMECKKALTEAGGDIEVAIENLRKSSGLKAAKKAGRTAAEGAVVTRVADNGSYGVMVEINSETDFVARDDNFIAFADKIADAFFAAKSEDVAAVMDGDLKPLASSWFRRSAKTSAYAVPWSLKRPTVVWSVSTSTAVVSAC